MLINHRWLLWLIACALLAVSMPNPRAEVDEDEEAEEIELSVAQIQTFLSERVPEAVELLERVKKEEPFEDYQEALERAAEFVEEYHFIEQEDGKKLADRFLHQHRLELRIEALTLAWEDSEPKDAQARQAMNKKLQSLVTELFDHELASSKLELEAVRIEVESLENEITELSTNRETLISEEVARIMEEWVEEDEEDE